MRQRCSGVVVQGVGLNESFRASHAHVIVEHGLTCLGAVLSPVRRELVVSIDEPAPIKEVCELIQPVVVEAVGIESLLIMLEHHIHSGMHDKLLAIVVGTIASQRERVSLLEPHMSKRLDRIRSLIEICTITPELRPFMAELHLSRHYLRSRLRTIQVILQHVGMYQIHPLVNLLPWLPCRSRRGKQPKPKEA